jgi:hypothetical protein
MANFFYVQVAPDPTDKYALCNYFSDFACTQPVASPLKVPKAAGAASFVLVPYLAEANPNPNQSNDLILVGAIADRVDTPAIDPTLIPATTNTVTVQLPVNQVITQGVLLVFSSQGTSTTLYATSDPQVENSGT